MSLTESKRGIIYKDETFFIPSHMNYGKMAIDNMLRSKDKVALVRDTSASNVLDKVSINVLLIENVLNVKDQWDDRRTDHVR